MRQWLVNPKYLCRKHLMGEHVESHMFIGAINKGTSLAGFVNGGLVDVSKLHSRHEELVEEMKDRGYNHNSPLPAVKVEIPQNYYISCVDVEANIQDLKTRCPDCNKRISITEGAQHVSC